MADVALSALKSALDQVDFPSHKDDLIVAAEQSDAPQDVHRALRTLPPVEYDNIDEVIRSVTVDVGSQAGRQLHPDDRPTRPGVAERTT